MIISEKSPQNQTSQSTIDPLHRARAPPPPATRASRALAQRRASSTPRVRVSTVVASVSLSLPSLARFRGGSRRLRVPQKKRGRRADDARTNDRRARSRRRERARGNAEKYQNIAPASRRPSRPSRGRVGVVVGADRSRDGRGDRPFPDFLGCNHSFPSARGRARGRHTRVSTGARDSKGRGAKASVDVARARASARGRARAAVETRGARPETVSGARDVGVAR